jgi:hypothetical protein
MINDKKFSVTKIESLWIQNNQLPSEDYERLIFNDDFPSYFLILYPQNK